MEKIKFLNVDLDLYADSGLKKLLKAFGSSVILLNDQGTVHQTTKEFLCVEAAKQPKSIDHAIAIYYGLVRKLPKKARAIWDGCESRIFNIGIQSANKPHSKEFRISEKALKQLLAMQGEAVITIYAPFVEKTKKN